MPTEKAGGPSLETYIETRLNLLTKAQDKLEESLLVRIAAEQRSREATEKSIAENIDHLSDIFKVTQSDAKRAVDKAEAAQHAHNIASNEWRGTLNDFKSTLITKGEFDRLATEFAAYRLEQSRLNSQLAGAKEGAKETKDDSKAMWALVIAVGSALFQVVIMLMGKS